VALFAARDPDRPRYRTRFMRAGVVYVFAIAVMGIASGARPNNLIIWVFSAMIAALLVSGFLSGFMMTPLRATRIEPRRGRVGEPLLIRYELSNRSRFIPSYDLAVTESVDTKMLEPAGQAWALHVGPGDTVHAEAVFRPLRRGAAQLRSFEVASTFPFGLLRKIVRITARGEVLIHPEILPIRADLLARVTSGAFGGQRLSQKGASLRTAPGEDARTLEERAIVLAASTIALADRLGYEYALSVAGLAVPPVALRKGHFHREKIMSLLAAIDLDQPRVPGNGLSSSDERASLVCVHPDRADTAIAPDSAWHFTARQIDTLVDAAAATGAATAAAAPSAAGGAA